MRQMSPLSLHSPFGLILKRLLRKSERCMFLAYRLRGIRFVDNLQDLDRLLQDISKRHPVFDDEAIAESSRICYRLRNLKLPKDDSSAEYVRRQRDIYKYLSGRSEHDPNQSDREIEAKGGYRSSGSQDETSPSQLGKQLMVAGMTIRAMNLPPGSRVVELGAGCGDVTQQLAQAGYQVTAVEINESYAERIKSRTEQCRTDVTVVNQDMMDFVRHSSEKYDAAVFVAAFHHCMNHLELLQYLSERITSNGLICFADEPVFLAENPFLPYSWGIRLDGQSLYFMRRYGWLELGFQSSYLRRTLSRLGWKMERIPTHVEACADIILARRDPGRSADEVG